MKAKITLLALALTLIAGIAFAQSSDSQIENDLQRRIGTIDIDVRNGVVTLSGTVPELSQRFNAVNTARRTVGVRQVVDRIRVVPAQRVSDSQIAASIRRAYEQNLSDTETRAITVNVNGGVVVLTGTLPSSYPKQLATTLASFVPGVIEIRNQIAVQPPTPRTDMQILTDVRDRYGQNPLIPEDRINVAVTGGVVTLTGTVSRPVQAEQAERVARFVPGVVDVQNNLFVSGS